MTEIRRYLVDDAASSPYQRKAPWAEAVEVPPNASLLFVSGQGPSMKDDATDPNAIDSYGDTRDQTHSTLATIQAILEDKGYLIGDIVKMWAYMRPDPRKGPDLDLGGFGEVYRKFFSDGTDGKPLPSRTRVEIRNLMNPAWLVEIEVIVAKT